MSALTKALVAARLELRGTVFKGGTNSHQNYKFVGHEQVITGGARDALLKHGLSLEQRSVRLVSEVSCGKTAGLLWEGVHALCHESGEERLYTFAATTQANDKSAFVASTALDRTAHLRILELAGSADEDPEHDSHDRQTPEPPRAVRAPQAKAYGVPPQVFLNAATESLLDTEDEDGLVEWFRKVDKSSVDENTKREAYTRFSAQCKKVGLIPKEVVALARSDR